MEEAIKKVKEDSDSFPLTVNHEYVDGSFVPSTDDVKIQIELSTYYSSYKNKNNF